MLSRLIKSLLDRLLAAIALTLLSPFLAILAIAIYLNMGSPVVFSQLRGGKNNSIFTFYKFRTMTDQRDRDGKLLPDMQRLTPLGKFLRQTSLDELPQLWNVLLGNMSLIGPRPLIAAYLERYTPEQARRHAVAPGITGWAQINGRNSISWEEKFQLDLWYIDHWSLWLDLKILLQTVIKIVSKEGIDEDQNTTSTEFMGTASKQ
ncbi:MAG: sugar transferase [Pleurocapsa minor HA4230-MV1]|jgi:lipopolysaccharide/colanic/teichoic acid biosynthesis glycosyltransferase|nr:sugar transferase [Pleurocapsa minor HA4230-MV1]